MSKDTDFVHNGDAAHDEIALEKPSNVDELNLKDVGAKYSTLADGIQFTPEQERKYLRRVDLRLMPLLFITWGLQYVDKGILNSAAKFGILEGLDLVRVTVVDGEEVDHLERFSYAIMTFYWGYVAGVLPATYLAQRMPLGKFVGCAVIFWGIVTMSTAGVGSYPGLIVNRFFLGVCESTPAPAFSLISAMWYKRNEQPLRIAFWYGASGLGSLIGGIVFFGIGHIQGALHPWKYQYLILGSVTVLWGIVIVCFLPDDPIKARFLSADERVLAVKRMQSAQTGISNSVFKAKQVTDTLQDPKTYLLVLTAFTITLINGALSGYGAIIIGSFGYPDFKSVLFSGIPGVVVFVTLITTGFAMLHFRNQRTNVFVITTLLVIAGCVMIWKSSWRNLAVPFAGFVLLGFFATSYVMLLSLMTANTAGHTKKALTSGLVWASAIVSNAVGPLLVKSHEADEHYPSLIIPIISVLALSIVMIVVLRLYLQLQNRARDKTRLITEADVRETAFEDMTDRENANFRYSW